MEGLHQVILRHVLRKKGHFIEHPETYVHVPLQELLIIVPKLPFTWRKWVLDACRVQASMVRNSFLLSGTPSYPSSVIIPRRRSVTTITTTDISDLFENIYQSPVSCCILSYFVRAESISPYDSPHSILDKSWEKEINAALLPHPGDNQVLDYDWLGMQGHDNPCYQLISRGLQSLRHRFSIHHTILLFPYYNNKKNVSYDTQDIYREYVGHQGPDKDITTSHLLRLYHETGYQVQGPLEVRSKWTYTDFKPRIYYAMGGEAYWLGIYAQPIANELCKILPSTNPFSRFNISRQGSLEKDELLVTYDYSSFTTSLSELKYFMLYLAHELRGITVDVLDVRYGVVSLDLGDYLHRYNTYVNQHQSFSLRRLYSHDKSSEYIFHQGRSGSLGTQGNIVFSTVCHGINLSSFTQRPMNDSCVGDDALAIIVASLLPAFVDHTTKLGDIAPDKFTTWKTADPPTEAERQQFKYLKRPLTVDFIGEIRTGILDSFPNLGDIFAPEGDGTHSSSNLYANEYERVKTFCMQVGRFITSQSRNVLGLSYTTEEDAWFVIECFQVVYDRYRIDVTGQLPGSTMRLEGENVVIDFFAPPIDHTSVLEEGWMERMYHLHHNEMFTTVVRVEAVIPPPQFITVGSIFRCSSNHKLTGLMEELGYFEVTPILMEVEFDEKYKRFYDGIFFSGARTTILAECRVLREPPEYYLDVSSWFHLDRNVGDPFEALTDNQTVFTD
jgi:hypothetical protein